MQLHIEYKYRVVSIYTNCLPIILTISTADPDWKALAEGSPTNCFSF